MAVENVKNLHTALIDTRAAYELALKDTEDADVAGICREMISLRHSDHLDLHQSLILAGEVPDENGSFMSMIHETVIGVRAAISGISKKTLRLALHLSIRNRRHSVSNMPDQSDFRQRINVAISSSE